MCSHFRKLSIDKLCSENELSIDTLLINMPFSLSDITNEVLLYENPITLHNIKYTQTVLETVCKYIKSGGLLFIYGYPAQLSEIAVWLNSFEENSYHYLFKYWIALEYLPVITHNSLPQSHIGLLVYLKTKSVSYPPKFTLDTKHVRVPHSHCKYCDNMLHDWGGKKDKMNPLGYCLSDVWKDIVCDMEMQTIIPKICLQRIYDLCKPNGENMVYITLENQ